ncbi:MAG: PhoH family protein [Gammaproteobacteria bacterium]
MNKRLFVIDSNVLMHDPSSLFRFQEHDLFIPMMVLEELDHNKKGRSEVARNARQASRFIDEIMSLHSKDDIEQGLKLELTLSNDDNTGENVTGRLFLQTREFDNTLPESLPGSLPDNNILGTAIALQEKYPDKSVTLVSKDINLRIKAAVVGIHAEDYHNDKVLEDVDLLYTGHSKLDENFWETHSKEMDSWMEEGRTYYKLHGPEVSKWSASQFLYSDSDNGFEAIVRSVNDDEATIETLKDYKHGSNIWGINARNREQNFALNLLMDPEIDFVTLIGTAGTGKTLLTLAAGLEQTLEQKLYTEIIMTRVTVPVGEEIGYLPGTEEEKMTPWMGALMDNLEVLTQIESGGDWGRAATNDLLANRIKIRSVNFMRGRTFLNRYIIIDEAQNLTSKQLKTLVTRAGPGTKVVCLGNIAQIDTPYLTETTSGLTYVIDRFRNWEHSGHITLIRGERSRLADFSSEVL